MKVKSITINTKIKKFSEYGIYDDKICCKLPDARWIDYETHRLILKPVTPIKKKEALSIINKIERSYKAQWWYNGKHFYNGDPFKSVEEAYDFMYKLVCNKKDVYIVERISYDGRLWLRNPRTNKFHSIARFKNCSPVYEGFKELNK